MGKGSIYGKRTNTKGPRRFGTHTLQKVIKAGQSSSNAEIQKDLTPEWIVAHLEALMCPWCPRGPFKVPLGHIARAHNIRRLEVKELARVLKSTSFISEEVREERSQHGRLHYDPKKLHVGRSRPRTFSSAGRAAQSAKSRAAHAAAGHVPLDERIRLGLAYKGPARPRKNPAEVRAAKLVNIARAVEARKLSRRVEKVCEVCGDTVITTKYMAANRKTCGRDACIKVVRQRANDTRRGHHSGGKDCEVCGRPFVGPPSTVARQRTCDVCRGSFNRKLTAEQIREAVGRMAAGESQAHVAEDFGVSQTTMCYHWRKR